ncbi:hypothetical protein OH76DRAFT_1499921 [Lentinus brumalis]|uniref:Uncharacterized protein n=1 Tax=Lentinus brumalis TaxID=2498619 RepID=A0A371CNB3_9APHY|nr:hypothetical protein OH76DRAFT_1499921 [Polyporus brumalis]
MLWSIYSTSVCLLMLKPNNAARGGKSMTQTRTRKKVQEDNDNDLEIISSDEEVTENRKHKKGCKTAPAKRARTDTKGEKKHSDDKAADVEEEKELEEEEEEEGEQPEAGGGKDNGSGGEDEDGECNGADGEEDNNNNNELCIRPRTETKEEMTWNLLTILSLWKEVVFHYKDGDHVTEKGWWCLLCKENEAIWKLKGQ